MRKLFVVVWAFSVVAANAQTANTKANWKAAERFSPDVLRPFVYGSTLTPGWINKTDVFWYAWKDSDGTKFWRVDCHSGKRAPLFDSAHMAALLSEAAKRPYDTTNLPITTVTFDEKSPDLIRFDIDNVRWEYDLKKDALKNLGRPTPGDSAGGQAGQGQGQRGQGRFGGRGGPNADFHNWSPDKSAFVYAQDFNLYYVGVAKGKETPPIQLTSDGEKWYSFGSRQEANERQEQQRLLQQQQQLNTQRQTSQRAGQNVNRQAANPDEKRVHANVTWSKDSKRFFVTREDERKVKDLYLVNSLAEPRPALMTYRYSMPGEADVAQTELLVFDPDKRRLNRMPVEKFKDQTLLNIHWQDTTSDSLRFVRRDRLQRTLELCELDLKINAVKPLITESVENASLEFQPVHYVKPGGDFVWWSERSGWGHFYLYSNDGKLKNAVTTGPWRANSFVDIDGEKGNLYCEGVGYLPQENPYYRHLFRVHLDGTGLTMLDPGDADHVSTLSTDKRYLVDVASRVDLEPTAVLRSDTGKVLLPLEHMDLAKLKEAGWQMPETFRVKAADGVTDIYGNMWKPADFDPHKKYPIIAHVYPGPQTESVASTFNAASGEAQLAQLGFIVIQIGNRGGNPMRSNAYQNFGYFNLRDYGLADKKAGIEQLAARYPWIDIDRVGIYGHSGGGFMTAAALMLPPYNSFFKVGVSSSGNHDNNVYNQNWSEQYHGLKEVMVTHSTGTSTDNTLDDGPGDSDDPTNPPTYQPTDLLDAGFPDDDSLPLLKGEGQGEGSPAGQFINGTTNKGETKFDIHVPTNAELAANLKGNLLLAHGDMDNNVHYAGTIRLMNALMRAGKRFDFLLIPGKPHGYGDLQGYFNQRMMEYFATYLLGDRYGATADISDHK